MHARPASAGTGGGHAVGRVAALGSGGGPAGLGERGRPGSTNAHEASGSPVRYDSFDLRVLELVYVSAAERQQ